MIQALTLLAALLYPPSRFPLPPRPCGPVPYNGIICYGPPTKRGFR